MKLQIKWWGWLILILVVGAVVRFGWFGQSPPSLNWDEASLGYNAYSIALTAKDEWNRLLPISFEAFGDFKLPVYIYASVPWVKIFGLSEWSIRLTSMLAGVVSIGLVYLIGYQLFNDRKIGLAAAGLMAISSWAIFFSRAALEANLSLTLVLLGIYGWLLARTKPLGWVIGSIGFGLSLFTYNSARVVVPLLVGWWLLISWKKLNWKLLQFWLAGVILLVAVGFAGYQGIAQDSSARYYWVSIIDQGAINYLNESRGLNHWPLGLEKLIFNRYVYFTQHFLLNYLSHFGVNFLFLEGGSNYQFSVPGWGMLNWFEAPLILIGLWQIWRLKKIRWFILGWWLLAPVASAVTREAPHPLRDIYQLGAWQLIAAVGFWQAINWFNSRKLQFASGLLVVGLVGYFGWYYSNYLNVYPKQNSQSWQYGMKQMVDWIDERSDQPIYVSKRYGEAHIFYLFYSQYDPVKYQSNPSLVRYSQTN